MNPQLLILKLQDNKPVCGAIIFNKDHTKLLVIKVKDKYGFPKGKWNQNEEPDRCAAREVFEETGISIYDKIDSKIRIEFDTHGSSTYFFIAKGVSEAERVKIDKKEID
jgi:mRNA-decapping enzyme subunit 2